MWPAACVILLCSYFCCQQRGEGQLNFDSLQQALSAIPPNEYYVMLDDFNALVGSRVVDDLWW